MPIPVSSPTAKPPSSSACRPGSLSPRPASTAPEPSLPSWSDASAARTYIAARMRAVRTARGLTQQAIASVSGVQFQQVQKYETGLNRLPANRLPALALALGVTPMAFLPWHDDHDADALPALTPHERALLESYRASPLRAQAALRQMAKTSAAIGEGAGRG